MADANNNTTVIDTLELDPADGQQYIVELRDMLIELLMPCQTIEHVEDKLKILYPNSKLVEIAIKEARKSRNDTQKVHKVRHHSSSSGGGSFTGTIHNFTSFAVAKVREGFVGSKLENEVSKFKMALIEYIIDEVLKLAGNFVKNKKGNFIITRSDIRTAMHVDEDLLDMFLSDDKSLLNLDYNSILSHRHHNQSSSLTYKQKVKNMVDSEILFIRNLNIIIKVFKAQLEGLPHKKQEVAILFCNIDDLHELSKLLLTKFYDALESMGQEEIPYIGAEIFDIAQAEEFHDYYNFAYSKSAHVWREAYLSIISDEATMTSIRTAGQYFDLAVKDYLPRYLLTTIIHFFEYYENICDLYELSKKHTNFDDQLALKETISILIKTKKCIEDLLKNELERLEPHNPEQEKIIRDMLSRRLEGDERNMPLHFMPPQDLYIFSEPDSNDNILYDKLGQKPVIKYATLPKLVEKLTYHNELQPTIVDAFLTTYRSFISNPKELLDLLIMRFNIPDPPLEVVCPNFAGLEVDLTNYKLYRVRFREQYSRPVKMRVINVLKSWIKNHYYDFERNPDLLLQLHKFLDTVYENEKIWRKLIVSIRKSIDQKSSSKRDEFKFMSEEKPPAILWHFARADERDKFDILTLHPIEFARQLTLVEFDLFRAVKPSELLRASEDTKDKDRYKYCPNIKLIENHFTFFSYWIRKCIVEAEDFDKRIAIYTRAIEIMGALRYLNNFQGLLMIGSAMQSVPISRLKHTEKALENPTGKILDDYKDISSEGHLNKLERALKTCNPPCIPFLGLCVTRLIHIKEGNKNYNHEDEPNSPETPGTPLQTNRTSTFFGSEPPKMINFYKQSMKAKLVAEVVNYQNLPYCLTVEPEIRRFIECIESEMMTFARTLPSSFSDNNGFTGYNEIEEMVRRLDNYLYEQSCRIEPKDGPKPQRSKSKQPDCYKSPGIKVNNSSTTK